jgi:prepilin-type N-terminal cleavage/methylation domain-containing protein
MPVRKHPTRRRGFTMIECVCAITVLAAVASVVLPVVSGATSAYAAATRARDVSENTAYALDRVLLLLRDTPIRTSDATADLAAVSATHAILRDGRGIRLDGTTLLLVAPDGTTAPLLRGVEAFEIGAFIQNGTASSLSTPGLTWIYTVRLRISGFEVRGRAFIRARSLG